MTHLTPDELVDAVEGALAPARQSHLTECPACRDEVAQLGTILREATAAGVPEPSPLFWDRFSARVREEIAREPEPASWIPRWLQLPVLAPLGALALLVLTLASVMPRHATPLPETAAFPSDAAIAASDSEWAMVSELVGPLDLETAAAAGISLAPGTADKVILQLNAAEHQELLRLMQEEIEMVLP